jgi:membrane fusion protein (multidrug efflux system)
MFIISAAKIIKENRCDPNFNLQAQGAAFIVSAMLGAWRAGAPATSRPAAAEAGAMPVTVIEMQPQKMPTSIEIMAQTEGARETEVRARVGGILVKRLYQEGDTVKAGQPLFQIDRAV